MSERSFVLLACDDRGRVLSLPRDARRTGVHRPTNCGNANRFAKKGDGHCPAARTTAALSRTHRHVVANAQSSELRLSTRAKSQERSRQPSWVQYTRPRDEHTPDISTLIWELTLALTPHTPLSIPISYPPEDHSHGRARERTAHRTFRSVVSAVLRERIGRPQHGTQLEQPRHTPHALTQPGGATQTTRALRAPRQRILRPRPSARA